MSLSTDLASQFAKITNDGNKTNKEVTVYGTAVEYNEKMYVKLDGSDLLTPADSTATIKAGERVAVTIKNHSATVIGNMSTPSASSSDVNDLSVKVGEFEKVISKVVTTDKLEAIEADIVELRATDATISGELTAGEARIDVLETDNATIKETLTANKASIDQLETNKLDADVANLTYATISNLDVLSADFHDLESTYGDFVVLTTDKFTATDADIETLRTEKLSATDADLKYANIDFSNIGKAAMEYFYAESGLIRDVTVGEGTITGNLVGVTIKGDLIEGNTIVAEKLVIKGEDGLYYKLNTDGVTTESEQTNYNSINGSIITANSITATKINVDDLVAFDATIGGFNITNNSIYSGVKETVDNTTRGVYMDNAGQMAFGDSNNFVKYYKDADGNYKLNISAQEIRFGSNNRSVETAIKQEVENIEIGGRNLFINTGMESNEMVCLKNASPKPSSALTSWTNSEGVLSLNYNTDSAEIYYCFMTPIIDELYGLEKGNNYTLSGRIRVTTDSGVLTSVAVRSQNNSGTAWTGGIQKEILTSDSEEWVYFSCTDVIDSEARGYYSSIQLFFDSLWSGTIELSQLKFEKGNKATDWTPAPEDMATSDDLANVSNDIATNAENIQIASSMISQLAESISSLVIGENGESLMIQTEDGWVFNFSKIQEKINLMSNEVENLNVSTSEMDERINALNTSIGGSGISTDYIRFEVKNGNPTISLGETDSDMQSSISNQKLNISKAEIRDELTQGGFSWLVRNNGNYGLVWKGDK